MLKEEERIPSFDERTAEQRKKSLISTLQGRLDLWNYSERGRNKRHKTIRMSDLGIELEEDSIRKWTLENNKKIDELREWYKANGTEWQKKRLAEPWRPRPPKSE